MAIRKLKWRVTENGWGKLRRRIVEEMLRPDDQPVDADAPAVFQEEGTMPNMKHYYVVSDDFDGIDHATRSEIILQAIEAAQGKEAVMETSSAIGLTKEEAEAVELPLGK